MREEVWGWQRQQFIHLFVATLLATHASRFRKGKGNNAGGGETGGRLSLLISCVLTLTRRGAAWGFAGSGLKPSQGPELEQSELTAATSPSISHIWYAHNCTSLHQRAGGGFGPFWSKVVCFLSQACFQWTADDLQALR